MALYGKWTFTIREDHNIDLLGSVITIAMRYIFGAAVCYLALWAVMAIVYQSILLRNAGLQSWNIHEKMPYKVPVRKLQMRLAAIGALTWPATFVPIVLWLLHVMVASHVAFHRIHKKHFP